MKKIIRVTGTLIISSLFLLSSCEKEVTINEEEFFKLIEKGEAQRVIDDYELKKLSYTIEIKEDSNVALTSYVIDGSDENNYYYLCTISLNGISAKTELKKENGVYILSSLITEELTIEEAKSSIEGSLKLAYSSLDAKTNVGAGDFSDYETVNFYKNGDNFGVRFERSENSEKGEFHINKYSFFTHYEFSGIGSNNEERLVKITATYN